MQVVFPSPRNGCWETLVAVAVFQGRSVDASVAEKTSRKRRTEPKQEQGPTLMQIIADAPPAPLPVDDPQLVEEAMKHLRLQPTTSHLWSSGALERALAECDDVTELGKEQKVSR